jgi:UDP-glucose 4-epimerase
MRVIVTGSSGRLGRTVAAGLAAAGHDVTALDRTPTGAGLVEEIAVDVADAAGLERLFADRRPEAVVHLAAIAVPFSAPERDILLTNTRLAYTVLAAAARTGVPRTLAASSPTVIGYGAADWRASAVPLDEEHPRRPTNAYALSKVMVEEQVAMFSRTADAAFGVFRPCYVLSPEEWAGAPTQQGHTLIERLDDPALAAVSLFNYLDARDAADFVDSWITADPARIDGETFFVGASDALARRPVSELWRQYAPGLGDAADGLDSGEPVFSIAKAERLLGWTPSRRWRDHLVEPAAPTLETQAS